MQPPLGRAARHRIIRVERSSRLGRPAASRRSRLGLGLQLAGVGHSRDESVAASGLPRIDRTMSDYLGNLIARTVSPTVAVRPQLPSFFEPAPAARETKSGPEFEQQSFVEQAPVTQPSEKLAPTSPSIPTPRQSVFREPEQTVPEISRARKILKT